MNFQPRSRRDFLQLMGVCALPLGAISLLRLKRNDEAESLLEFDTGRLKRLQNDPSEVVLIGNSMVYCRLNIHYLPNLLDPLTVEVVAEGGTRSLQWFLWFKNFAAATRPAPRVVFLFYRDFDFGRVDTRISGAYLDSIRKSMRGGDEKYLWLARGQSMTGGPVGWLQKTFDDHPENKKRRKRIDDIALDTAALFGPQRDHEIQQHVKEVFDIQNLRSDVKDAGAQENDHQRGIECQFTADPRESYLSYFDEVAKARDIRLVFYRVRRRPEEDNTVPQSETLIQYTKDFRQWIEAHGHAWVDETDDARISGALFRDGDHLFRENYNRYTEMFVERVRHLLPKPFTPEAIEAGKREAQEENVK